MLFSVELETKWSWCPDAAGLSSGWWLAWAESCSQVPTLSLCTMWSVHNKGTLKGAVVREAGLEWQSLPPPAIWRGNNSIDVLQGLIKFQNKMCQQSFSICTYFSTCACRKLKYPVKIEFSIIQNVISLHHLGILRQMFPECAKFLWTIDGFWRGQGC